ncbi:hypothetical protein [Acinetobacter gyllenbergii]|uniref:hypothetical protein n=1 Tax=Acinetobacter gyllenbergii TaxID=134534 RepID=UPI00241FC6FD|nr:hypothetical protein [Acinetobacter gyllenbergii]
MPVVPPKLMPLSAVVLAASAVLFTLVIAPSMVFELVPPMLLVVIAPVVASIYAL